MDLVRGRWLVLATVAALVAFAGSAVAMGELAGPAALVLVLANTLPLLLALLTWLAAVSLTLFLLLRAPRDA